MEYIYSCSCSIHNEMAHKLVLWQPKTTGRAIGRCKTITFVNNLIEDTELVNVNELITMMLDRDVWRFKVEK